MSTKANRGTSRCSLAVRTQEDKASEDDASSGKYMEVVDNGLLSRLHPITVMTFPDKTNARIACKALLDQCCTDEGLIIWKLASMLGLSGERCPQRNFVTAAGTFSTDRMVSINDLMLPCLSPNRTFTIRLMVIPEQCSHNVTYGVIMGQETMRRLDLDTSVRNNTISWGEDRYRWSQGIIGAMTASKTRKADF